MNCKICNGPTHPTLVFKTHKILHCPLCDYSFCDSPLPLEKYDESYYTKKHVNWFRYPNHYVMNLITKKIEGLKGKLIDVGSGDGFFLRKLKAERSDLQLTGIDFGLEPKDEKIRFFKGDFIQFETDEKFELITSLGVIENIPSSPKGFVDKIAQLCNSGAHVFLYTSNDKSFLARLVRFFYQLGIKGPAEIVYDRGHSNHFNTQSLSRLLESSGFKVQKVFRHNRPLSSVDIRLPFVLRFLMKIPVALIFAIGTLTRQTHMQTIHVVKN